VNANDNAYPELSTSWVDRGDGMTSYSNNGGLTKRELIAAMAMQGLLATDETSELNWREIAAIAVKNADALIEELSK
jgi:hypothetical protein